MTRIDFSRMKSTGRDQLKKYIARLETAVPSRLSRAGQLAFWINLYNAKSADLVLESYPVLSVLDIDLMGADGKEQDGPWKAVVVRVEGRRLSLEDIENKVLRQGFADPRINYALNRFAIGSPNLPPEAFDPRRVDRQLDLAATMFVNHERGVSIKPGGVEASRIYQWFEADFGGAKGVLAHMSRYARADLRQRLARVKKIDTYVYDWRLNDIERR